MTKWALSSAKNVLLASTTIEYDKLPYRVAKNVNLDHMRAKIKLDVRKIPSVQTPMELS
jgi:hypothetical protein